MTEVTNLNIIISKINRNLEAIEEIRDEFKECFLKIKNFILNLNTAHNDNGWNSDVISFSAALSEIEIYLMNIRLFKEQNVLILIDLICVDILYNSKLFNKYSYFIIELLDLFTNLISHLGDKNYEYYYDSFINEFNKYKEFYIDNILHVNREYNEKISLLNMLVWGSSLTN